MAQEGEYLIDIMISASSETQDPSALSFLVILTNKSIIQLDAKQYKHVKLAEKVSLPGSRLLKVSSKQGILCIDPLQGIQVIALQDLRAARTWKFNELLEQRYKALSDKYTLYQH